MGIVFVGLIILVVLSLMMININETRDPRLDTRGLLQCPQCKWKVKPSKSCSHCGEPLR